MLQIMLALLSCSDFPISYSSMRTFILSNRRQIKSLQFPKELFHLIFDFSIDKILTTNNVKIYGHLFEQMTEQERALYSPMCVLYRLHVEENRQYRRYLGIEPWQIPKNIPYGLVNDWPDWIIHNPWLEPMQGYNSSGLLVDFYNTEYDCVSTVDGSRHKIIPESLDPSDYLYKIILETRRKYFPLQGK